MIRSRLIAAGATIIVAATTWGGGSPVAGAPGAMPVPPVAELGPRNYTQRAANKLRPNSLLRADGAQVRFEAVELRGVLAQQRDRELGRHYGRVAELDVIVELAEKHHRLALAEQVEAVRRKETERFFWSMQQVRLQSLGAVDVDQHGAAASQPAPSAIYRQAADTARQRLTLEGVQTRLADLELQIDRERDNSR